jgi:hypothetical protein
MKTLGIIPPPPHSEDMHRQLVEFFIKVETTVFQNAIINCKLFDDYNDWLFLNKNEFDFIANKVKSKNVTFTLEKEKHSVAYGEDDLFIYKV